MQELTYQMLPVQPRNHRALTPAFPEFASYFSYVLTLLVERPGTGGGFRLFLSLLLELPRENARICFHLVNLSVV